VLAFPGWRYVHQEGWVGAVTEHNGVCFMAVLQGREKDLEPYLSGPKQYQQQSRLSSRSCPPANYTSYCARVDSASGAIDGCRLRFRHGSSVGCLGNHKPLVGSSS